MLKNVKCMLAVVMILIFALTAGCDEQTAMKEIKGSGAESGEQQQKNTGKEESAKRQGETVKVYFANEDGTKLVAKAKPAKKDAPDKYTAAMQMLLLGTADSGEVSVIPAQTKLNGVKVEKGIAYVDFSSDMVKNFNGGSTGEIMLVGSIVNTLTEFSEVKAVQILIDGRIVETVAGHMDISEPLKRFRDI